MTPRWPEPTDEGAGRWLVIDGHIAEVTAFVPATNTYTFRPDHPSPPDDNTPYELWDQKYNPTQVNALMNQAMIDAQTNGVFTQAVDDTIYLPPSSRRIKAPASWNVLRSVEMTIDSMGYGSGGTYLDLRPSLEAHDDAEGDDTTFPFHTVKVSGTGQLTLDQNYPLGLYNAIGWEVAGTFEGKTAAASKFEFIKQDFDPFTASYDSDGHLLVDWDAGASDAYILSAYLYREDEVQWMPLVFTIWQNSGEIEIDLQGTGGTFISNEGLRLRLHGGEALGWRDSDGARVDLGSEEDGHHPDVTPSFIRMHTLVSLLRSIPEGIVGEDGTPIRREWEVRVASEMAQLPRMQGVRYL